MAAAHVRWGSESVAGRLGFRHDGDRRQQHGGDQQNAQQRGVARGPPRERDPLQRGEIREHGEEPERRLEQIEQGAGDQADHALRTLHHAHGAAHADRLGARLRVAHHHRADQSRHRDDGAARVGRAGRRARRSPSSTTRSEYRSMTESRNAPNADTWPEARASEPSKKSHSPARMRRAAAGCESARRRTRSRPGGSRRAR